MAPIQFGQIIHFRPDTPEGAAIWTAIEKQCESNGAPSIFTPGALGDTFELKQSGAEPVVFNNPKWFQMGNDFNTADFFLADGAEKDILHQLRMFYGKLIEHLWIKNEKTPESQELIDSMDQLYLDTAKGLVQKSEAEKG